MIMLQMIVDSNHTLIALDVCYPQVVDMQKVHKPMEMFSPLHEDLCSPHLCYSLFKCPLESVHSLAKIEFIIDPHFV